MFSPLEQFEIYSLLTIIIGPFNLSLTNFFVCLLLVAFLLFSMFDLVTPFSIVSNRALVLAEAYLATVSSIVNQQLARPSYIPLFYSLFISLLAFNLVGMVPYSFAITSQFVIVFGLSISIFIAINYIGIREHGLGILSLFLPAGTPLGLVPLLIIIELLSYLSRPLSLGIRLGANIFAGHTILNIISSFSWKLISKSILGITVLVLSYAFLSALVILEIGIAIIQAYVFTLLSVYYLKDCI